MRKEYILPPPRYPMAVLKRVRRIIRKIGIAAQLKENRAHRGYMKGVIGRMSTENLVRIGLSKMRYNDRIMGNPADVGAEEVTKEFTQYRKEKQRVLNKTRGKGFNSPWKLSGVRKPVKK
jgi:hypothetical protein